MTSGEKEKMARLFIVIISGARYAFIVCVCLLATRVSRQKQTTHYYYHQECKRFGRIEATKSEATFFAAGVVVAPRSWLDLHAQKK